MANPLFEARLELSALPVLLQPRLALPGETPLAGLREVPPACLVSCTGGGPSVRRYWRLTSEPHHESFPQTAHHVRALLAEAVRGQAPASGPCGAMLSGGVDSTSVAALAARSRRREHASGTLDTFCVEFGGAGTSFVPTELRPDVDSPYAAAAALFIGSRHHQVTATMADLLGAIPATRKARDLPGWGQFDASMYLLFQQMRRTCAVALSGEAADEFFGGYPYFFKPELVARDSFPWLGDGPQLCDYLSAEVKAAIDPCEDTRARYHQLLSGVPRLDGEDRLNARMREVLFLGMSGPLAVILDRKERMSMASGLEVRLPFCDHRLVQYVWNVPWPMKSRGGLKGLLKAAMADSLPPATLGRAKSAYPHVQDPGHEQALLAEARGVVNDSASPLAGIFDTPRLNSLMDEVCAGTLRAALPGGASGAQLFVQLVEAHHWVGDYQVSL
jgi:asparagine synthase (glutamine-hydrolysing)/putative beta-lactam synthetase